MTALDQANHSENRTNGAAGQLVPVTHQPTFQTARITVYQGDALATLRALPDASVDCCVTSPPYWGLRDYGTATWEGGDRRCANCPHSEMEHNLDPMTLVAWCAHRGECGCSEYQPCDHKGPPRASTKSGLKNDERAATSPFRDTCGKCGARRIDSQLGLEPTPALYVEKMVEVFREVRRVLRPQGTVFLNLGDSYAGSWGAQGRTGSMAERSVVQARSIIAHPKNISRTGSIDPDSGLKPKDMVGIPWRVAFALQQPYYTGTIKAEADRIWFAAMMDGEGTFTILSTTSPHGSGNSYPPIAQIRMTALAPVDRAASLVGVASPAQYPPSARGNRAVYQWRVSGGRAATVAAELYPYLIVKKQQALVVWNHQQVRDSYETKRGVTIPAAALEKQKVCRDLIRRMNRDDRSIVIPSWMQEPPSLYEPGWYLRSDVIWAKPNPMPESVTDRPTKAHEYVFLLSKSPRYFFDQEAVSEKCESDPQTRDRHAEGYAAALGDGRDRWSPGARTYGVNGTRNIRTVWTIATQPYPEAHFATFPEELPRRCIKAGCPEQVCGNCGTVVYRGTRTTPMRGMRGSVRADLGSAEAASEVLLDAVREPSDSSDTIHDERLCQDSEGIHSPVSAIASDGDADGLRARTPSGDGGDTWTDAATDRGGRSHQRGEGRQSQGEPAGSDEESTRRDIKPWASADGDLPEVREPLSSTRSCGQCGADLDAPGAIRPGVVLDVFAGSGTTLAVARDLGRKSIGIELSPEYVRLIEKRCAQQALELGA